MRDCDESPESEVLCLHEEYRPRLLRYVASLGLKPPDAEDVIQETFLALFRHLKAGKPRSNLAGWVFRVAHRLALKRRTLYALSGRTEGWKEQGIPVAVFSPEDEVLFSEQQRRLQNIFLTLPEMDRLCLQLRSEGLKYRDISSVLNVSLGFVHKSLSRSFGKLIEI
ncbi:MAG: sigma-70 family RNA polymerase sigma factor [Acidobacteria bacterium]|nr:sigma-70 family RNA polymerase sigma factor [Acidobacteriota bacterium]